MSRVSRRNFLQGAAAGLAVSPLLVHSSLAVEKSKAASEKINLAVVGLGNQGSANLNAIGANKDAKAADDAGKGGKSPRAWNMVALCDVDDKTAGKAYEHNPGAKKFYDFRKMFDEMEKQIDAVLVATPDHTHFHPSYMALQRGKHLYCEKPLAHSVWEIRELTKLAAEKKLATQLGAQRHTLDGLRDGVEIVKAGTIGQIKEVHSWIASPRGMYPDLKEATAPENLKWDLWLGPTPDRHYVELAADGDKSRGIKLVPYQWRFYWDYGTGEAGNWGCHILDIPYWALDLKYPTKVKGSGGPTPDPIKTPKEMQTEFQFAATDKRPAVTLHWYQGKPKILESLKMSDKELSPYNNYFVGTEGTLLCGFSGHKLLPDDKFKNHKVKQTFAKSPGFHEEWFNAIRGGEAATCNFNYSGPMAETVILANLAYRTQSEFAWDAAQLKAANDNVQAMIKPTFKKGWEV